MPSFLDPFRFILMAVAGWMNQRHLQAIDYLREENRVSYGSNLEIAAYASRMTSDAGWPLRRRRWEGDF